VLAPNPKPDLFVLDRYLAAATSGGISATLVLKQSASVGIDAMLQTELDVYEAIGYEWARVLHANRRRHGSCAGGMRGRDIRPGRQSGVGKSSLIGRFIPKADVEVGELVREEEAATPPPRRTCSISRRRKPDRLARRTRFAPAIDRLDSGHLGSSRLPRLPRPIADLPIAGHMREPGCAVIAASEAADASAALREHPRRLRRQV